MNNCAKSLFFHVDLDAFFASVEQLDHKEYRNKPLIICGSKESRGVVSTCSYEARKFGVHSAMPTYKAMQLCPKGIFIPPNMNRYYEKSYEVMSILKDFSPEVNQISIDEAFLNMSGTERLLGSGETSAKKLKELIKEKTGLTISIGVATNRYLAKIGSDFNKPDGLTIINEGEEAEFAKSLPLKKIWGVGKKTREQLEKKLLTTVPQLLKLDEEYLKKIVGNMMGTFIYMAIRGIDPGIYQGATKTPTMSAERTFPEDQTDKYFLETQLMELSHELRFRLLKENLSSRTVGIKIRYSDFSTVSIQHTESFYIQSAMELFSKAKDLFYKKWVPQLPIRLLGLSVQNLESEYQKQGELFSSEIENKRIMVEKAVDNVSKKTKINITKARFLGFIFVLLSFFSRQKIFSQTFDTSFFLPEAPQTLFDWKIGDSSIKFSAGGSWDLALTGIGFSFSKIPSGTSAVSFDVPVFSQTVDFSLALSLNNTWFFSGSFQDGFTDNYVVAGYKGSEESKIKELKIGNKGIYFPITFDDITFPSSQTDAFGFLGHFGDKNWNAYSLIRLTGIKTKEQVFSGDNEIVTEQFYPQKAIKGKWFIIPVESKEKLSSINNVRIFESDEEGNFTGSDGYKYRELNSNEFIFSKISGYITLKKISTQRIAIIFDDPTISFNANDLINETKSWFLSGGLSIEKYLYSNNEITISGNEAYLLQVPGFLNPLSIQSRYQIPGSALVNASREDISLLFNSTEERISDFSISIFEDSYSITNSTQLWLELIQNDIETTNELPYWKPSLRFPFVKNTTIYGTDLPAYAYISGTNAKFDTALKFYLSQDAFILESEAIPGSIKIYRNGKLDTNFTYNEVTGQLKLFTPAKENEIIRITYSIKSENTNNSLLETALALEFSLSEKIKLKAATGLQWNINKNKYIEDEESSPATFTTAAEISYKNENLYSGLQTSLTLSKENTTNLFRLQGMDASPELTLYPQYTWFYGEASNRSNLTAWPEICSEGFQINLKFRDNLIVKSDGSIIPGTSGTSATLIENAIGPYSTNENSSSITSMVMEWPNSTDTGYSETTLMTKPKRPWCSSYLCDESLDSLFQTGRISFALKNKGPADGHTLFSNDNDYTYDVYLQLGCDAQYKENDALPKTSSQVFDTQESDGKIITIKLTESDTSTSSEVISKFDTTISKENKWQTVTVQLTTEQLAKLYSQNSIRFIIVPRLSTITPYGWEEGALYVGILEGSGSEVYSKDDANCIISYDPALGTNNALSKVIDSTVFKKFNESQNTVLKITMAEDASATGELLNYKKPFSLYSYSELRFYFYAETDFSQNDSLELSLIKTGQTQQSALSLTIPLSESDGISKNKWHEILINLDEKKVFLDSTLLASDLYLNKTVSPSLIKWTCKLSDTNDSKKIFYIDELYLSESKFFSIWNNKCWTTYKNEWETSFGELSLNSFGETRHKANYDTTSSTHTISQEGEANISWDNFSLGGGFLIDNSEKQIIKNAFHQINFQSKHFVLKENYQYVPESGFSSHLINLSAINKNSKIDFSFAAKDSSEVLQNDKNVKFSTPIYFDNLVFSGSMAMQDWSTENSFSSQNSIKQNYIKQWSSSFINQFSDASSSYKRNIDFSNSIQFTSKKVSPSLTISAGTRFNCQSTKNETQFVKTIFSIPFKIGDVSLTPQFIKEVKSKKQMTLESDKTNNYNNWNNDYNNWGVFFNHTKSLFALLPIQELFSSNPNKIISDFKDYTSEQFFNTKYGITLQKPQTSKIWDLFIPVSFSTNYSQNLFSQGSSPEKTNKLSFSSGLTAYNLFGTYGVYPFFKFYTQDQIYQLYQSDIIWESGNPEFYITAYQSITLFLENSNSVEFSNTLTYYEEEVKNSFRGIFTLTGKTSLLETALTSIKNSIFKSSNKDNEEILLEEDENSVERKNSLTSPYWDSISKSNPKIERKETLLFVTGSKPISNIRKYHWTINFEHKTSVSFAEKLSIYAGVNLYTNSTYYKIFTGSLTFFTGLKITF